MLNDFLTSTANEMADLRLSANENRSSAASDVATSQQEINLLLNLRSLRDYVGPPFVRSFAPVVVC